MSEQLELLPDQKYIGNMKGSIISTYYDPRRKLWRLLINGRETFYDPTTREMMEWGSEIEAISWFEEFTE